MVLFEIPPNIPPNISKHRPPFREGQGDIAAHPDSGLVIIEGRDPPDLPAAHGCSLILTRVANFIDPAAPAPSGGNRLFG